ncbi:MAG: ArnT family glycosyltransferase [Aureliella sp.]
MRTVFTLLIFALVVRVGVLVADPSEHRLINGISVSQLAELAHDNGLDPDSYGRLALNLSRSGIYGFGGEATGDDDPSLVKATAFRPPLYPWLLSWLVSGDSLSGSANAILHVVLGLIAILLVYRTGRLLGLGRLATIPALGVMLDPLLLRASQLRMTETLATTLMLLIWWSLIEWQERHQGSAGVRNDRPLAVILGIGFVAGLAVLARPTFAPWCLFLCVGLWFWQNGRKNKSKAEPTERASRSFVVPLVFAMGLLSAVGPWTARNYVQLGRPIWATTHGGYTLLLANNPSLYQHFANNGPARDWDAESFHRAWSHRGDSGANPREESYWFSDFPPTSSQQPGELEDNALAYRSAIATISRAPFECIRASVYRLGWFWALWPHETGGIQRWAIAIWYSLFFGAAMIGLGQLIMSRGGSHETGFSKWLPGLVFVLILTLIHAFFWSNMRMRAPLMPVIYLLSAIPLGRYSR